MLKRSLGKKGQREKERVREKFKKKLREKEAWKNSFIGWVRMRVRDRELEREYWR